MPVSPLRIRKIPITKFPACGRQAPNKFQYPMTQSSNDVWLLEFGY
jgi:hypothetical protein